MKTKGQRKSRELRIARHVEGDTEIEHDTMLGRTRRRNWGGGASHRFDPTNKRFMDGMGKASA